MGLSSSKSLYLNCIIPSYAEENERRKDSCSDSSSNAIRAVPFSPENLSLTLAGSNLYEFTFAEMKTVTRNFTNSNFLGSGGFGPVYKGFIPDKFRPGLEAQHVAVKYLDQEGNQGDKEWMMSEFLHVFVAKTPGKKLTYEPTNTRKEIDLAEVRCLGQYRHPNLVKLIGYCCEEPHRILVYEYMQRGSLENHLFRSLIESLTWLQRLSIAVDTAKGLAFLHDAEKPLIYRDLKPANILLDSNYTAKLSDFGLAKDGPRDEDSVQASGIVGTHGYAAPEYIKTGHITAKCDVYSYGVVLLELLTGRRTIDRNRCSREQDLVQWARPYLTSSNKFHKIMDQKLEGSYPTKAAQKVALVAYQCLSSLRKLRPSMKEVVDTLEPLLQIKDFPICGTIVFTVPDADEDCDKLKRGDRKLVTHEEDQEKREHNQNRRRSCRISAIHAESGLHKLEAKDLYEWRPHLRRVQQNRYREREASM